MVYLLFMMMIVMIGKKKISRRVKGAEMTYNKEYTLHNGQKIYAEYNEYNICQVTKECIEMLLDLYQQGRADAIDDFRKEICKMITQSENDGNYRFYAAELKQAIADLAEQLKGQKK